MEGNRKGDLAEIKAVAWLWEQGYEVFRNCGCTGKIDLVAVKAGEILLIDVKPARWNGQGWVSNKGYLVPKHIKVLYYVGDNFSFRLCDLPKPDLS